MTQLHCSLDHSKLLALLRYEPSEGAFYRLTNTTRGRVGTRAGSQNRLGYRSIFIDGISYLEHRLAWFYVHASWPKRFIDHIDGNPSNNAIENLREADHIQNQQNAVRRGYSRKNHYPADPNPFEANINVNGKNVYLGRFPTAEAASAAYRAANEKYFGEFSFLRRGEFSCVMH